MAAVREIARELAAADPAHRALFERNADAYLARLRALDAGIANCIDSVPASTVSASVLRCRAPAYGLPSTGIGAWSLLRSVTSCSRATIRTSRSLIDSAICAIAASVACML